MSDTENKFSGTHWSKLPNRDEIMARIVAKNTGRKMSEEVCAIRKEAANKCGAGKWMLGRKMSVEQRLKRSITMKGMNAKENNPCWKGGVTPVNLNDRRNIENKIWRVSVFKRDEWICQKCKQKKQMLRAHHILNFADYPELRYEADNGITLCDGCHKQFHKIYGTYHTNKDQTMEYLNSQVEHV